MISGIDSLTNWQTQLDRLITVRDLSEKEVEKLTIQVRDEEESLVAAGKLRNIFITAANKAQQEVSGAIETVVTTALQAVFGIGYQFRINFVNRRGSTEADMVMVKGVNEVDPLDNSGLGAANIIAVALRAAFIALDGTTARFMSLDEPTAALMVKKQALAGGVLRTLCDKLGFQILLTTHSAELAECADVVYYVEQNKKGEAVVKRLERPELAREVIE
jgi:DNA repair exonuclease SbcCD ATPase subunit